MKRFIASTLFAVVCVAGQAFAADVTMVRPLAGNDHAKSSRSREDVRAEFLVWREQLRSGAAADPAGYASE